METIIIIFIGMFGLVIGSFLNVVIHRVPRKILMVSARSVCPKCSKQLKWYHNIPLFSYLFLRGRCAFCREKISMRYPLVELLNPLGYLFIYWQFHLTPSFFIYSAILSTLIVIFFIDLDFQIIPDNITLPGIVIALGVSFIPGGLSIVDALIGVLVGGGSLLLVAMLGEWLFKKEAMGGGDIKMAAMLGGFLGWQKVLFVFMSSAVIGLIVSLIIMGFSSHLRQKRVIPFGPFLALAAMLAICYGDKIISFYLINFVYVK